MAFTNNVMIVRHGLLAKLVKLWKENRLLEEIDRLPIELSPRKSKVIGRCCVHKERVVVCTRNGLCGSTRHCRCSDLICRTRSTS